MSKRSAICKFCGKEIADGEETAIDARQVVHAECQRLVVQGQSATLGGWAAGRKTKT